MSEPQKPLTDEEINIGISEMLERHCSQISEQINGSVQINITHVQSNGGTVRIHRGMGDLSARIQASRVWAHIAECAQINPD